MLKSKGDFPAIQKFYCDGIYSAQNVKQYRLQNVLFFCVYIEQATLGLRVIDQENSVKSANLYEKQIKTDRTSYIRLVQNK